ncbi:MAG: META domain-containing protein [Hyphomonas sp.]
MTYSHILMAAAAAGVLAACSGEAPPSPALEAPAAGMVEPASVPADVWTARGNEPGWTLTLDGTDLTFIHAYGELRHAAPQPGAVPVEGGRRYSTEDGVLSVMVVDGVCLDDATGMPYPFSVTVQLDDTLVRGCGGETNALLAGEWAVVSLNGEAVPAEAGVTLAFEPEAAPPPESPGAFVPGTGRVGGKAGCNNYGADYRIGGEGISIGDAFSTEMACEPDVMAREAAFFDTLRNVPAISFEEDGALVLSDHQDRQIRARR